MGDLAKGNAVRLNDCYGKRTKLSALAENKAYHWLKLILRGIGTVVLFVLALVVIFLLLISIPAVQRSVAKYAGHLATEQLGAEVRIGSIYVQPLGPIVLRDVYVGDLRNDTLFAIGLLKVKGVGVDAKAQTIILNAFELENGRFALATAADDEHSNLTNLFAQFEEEDTTTTSAIWTIRANRFVIDGLHFSFHDDRVPMKPFGIDFSHVDVTKASLAGYKLAVIGDSITAHLEQFSLRERSGFRVDQLTGVANVSGTGIIVDSLALRTPVTSIEGRMQFSSENWSSYSRFIDEVMMRVDLKPSRLDFADISFFASELEGVHLPISVQGNVRGTISELKGRNLDIAFGERSIFRGSAELSGLPDIENTFMLLDLDELLTDHGDLAQLPAPPFISGDRLKVPLELKELGMIKFRGNFTGFIRSFTAYGVASTAIGGLRTDISFERDTLSKDFSLSGRIATDNIRLGPLLHADILGPLAANIRINAKGKDLAGMRAEVEGDFPFFTLNGVRLTGISAKGKLERNLFNGALTVNDNALILDFEGLADMRGRWPLVDFRAELDHANLTALGIAPFDGYNTLRMDVDAQGRLSPDSLLGKLSMRDIAFCRGDQEHELGDIELVSSRMEGENVLNLNASFVDVEVIGDFLPTRLPRTIENVIYSVFPSLEEKVDFAEAEQNFRFTLETKNTGPVLDLVMPGLKIDSGSTAKGALDSRSLDIELVADLPGMSYGHLRINNMYMVTEKTMDVFLFSVKSDRQIWKDSIWFAGTSLTGKAYQDELEFALGWDDSNGGTNGDLYLLGDVDSPNSLSLDLLPSHLQFGRGDWLNVKPAHGRIEGSTIRIDSLTLQNDGQRITLDGTISNDPRDALHFDLLNVDLRNIEPFYEGPQISGLVSGDGAVYDLRNTPKMISYMCLDSLKVQKHTVGDLQFAAQWVDAKKAIDVSGILSRGAIKALDFNGEVSLKEGNDMDVELIMDRFDLGFIDPYLPEGISEIQGLVSGSIAVNGKLIDPQIEGELALTNAGLRIDYLNTLYRFSHELKVRPDMFALDQVTVLDEEGHKAVINGTIQHKGLKDWNFNVSGDLDSMLVLNTDLSQNELFYGKGYGTGEFELSAYAGNMEITVDARTSPGTSIHLPLGGSTDVSDFGFVQFVSGDSSDVEDRVVDLTGVTLDLNVEVTPDALFELIFDPTVGDILRGRGTGNIEMSVDQAGGFDMKGAVQVSEGDYLFTLRNVVNKRFQITPGGTITWFGDPLDAQLDLEAVYRLRAPLYDIMYEKNDVYRKRVPVDVTMRLKDRLLNPEIGFSVRLPTVDESIRTQVNSVLSTEQELNRQVFALIVMNRFVQPPNYTGAGSPGTGDLGASATGFELMSNQVSNWLSQISSDFDLGLNYRPGDNVTQKELEVALSTQLFNERLLFSTNVGVQYGAAQTTQNSNALVGDFQLEYLLTEDGKLRMKGYSISNDRNLNRASQASTTQGVGIGYREEFNTWQEFRQKIANIFRSDANDKKFD